MSVPVVIGLALAAIILLIAFGLRGSDLKLAAAALIVGGVGYALTAPPSPARQERASAPRAPSVPLTVERASLMGNFNAADHWLILADSFERRGDTIEAVGLLRSAVRAHPRDYRLWVGLGNALAAHAQSYPPAVAYAFDRADRLAPDHPAPKFFRGLVMVRSGLTAQGAAHWREALAESPADASWRPMIEDALAKIDQTGW